MDSNDTPIQGSKASLTVLVVDDEPLLCGLIAEMLRGQKHLVSQAYSGNEAIDLVQQHRFDVVFSDVRMPNGSGVEFLEKIRLMDPRIPVVVLMTGFSDFKEEDFIQRGCKAVLKKPFPKKVLLETLSEIIRTEFPERL